MSRVSDLLAGGWRRMFDTTLKARLSCGHTSGRATVLQRVGRPDVTVCGDCYTDAFAAREEAARPALGKEKRPSGGQTRGTKGGTTEAPPGSHWNGRLSTDC